MVFPKLTRQQIHSAGGKPIEIAWPEKGPQPRAGRTYTVQSSVKRAGSFSIEVKKPIELPEDKWRAVVVVAEERRPLRLNTRLEPDPDSIIGPGFPDGTAKTEYEPDQVPSDFQRRLDFEALMKSEGRREVHRRRVEIHRTEQNILTRRREGKPTAILEGRLDRAKDRLDRAEGRSKKGVEEADAA